MCDKKQFCVKSPHRFGPESRKGRCITSKTSDTGGGKTAGSEDTQEEYNGGGASLGCWPRRAPGAPCGTRSSGEDGTAGGGPGRAGGAWLSVACACTRSLCALLCWEPCRAGEPCCREHGGPSGTTSETREDAVHLGSCRPGHTAIRTRHAAQPVPRRPRTQAQPLLSRSLGSHQLVNAVKGESKSLHGKMTELLRSAHLNEMWNEVLAHSRGLGRGRVSPGAQVGAGTPFSSPH